MNLEEVKQFVILKVVPVVAAAVTTWLIASVHVLNVFGLTEGTVEGIIAQALTFGVTYVGSLFGLHKIAAGTYTPAAKAAASARRSSL